MATIQAHDSDISCIDFAPSVKTLDNGGKEYILVSGSKDRLTHVYLI